MSFNTFKKIIDQLDNPQDYGLVFAGHGDPMLHSDVEKFLQYSLSKGIKINDLIYNPAVADEKIINKLKKMPFNQIELSIPVTSRKMFDFFYNSKHDYSNFTKIIKMINPKEFTSKLRILSFNLGDNHEIKRIKDYFKGLNNRCIDECFVDSRGGLLYKLKEQNLDENCEFIRYATSVKWDGKVFLCCQQYNEEVIIGDINVEPLNKIIKRKFSKFPQDICKECNCELRSRFDR